MMSEMNVPAPKKMASERHPWSHWRGPKVGCAFFASAVEELFLSGTNSTGECALLIE